MFWKFILVVGTIATGLGLAAFSENGMNFLWILPPLIVEVFVFWLMRPNRERTHKEPKKVGLFTVFGLMCGVALVSIFSGISFKFFDTIIVPVDNIQVCNEILSSINTLTETSLKKNVSVSRRRMNQNGEVIQYDDQKTTIYISEDCPTERKVYEDLCGGFIIDTGEFGTREYWIDECTESAMRDIRFGFNSVGDGKFEEFKRDYSNAAVKYQASFFNISQEAPTRMLWASGFVAGVSLMILYAFSNPIRYLFSVGFAFLALSLIARPLINIDPNTVVGHQVWFKISSAIFFAFLIRLFGQTISSGFWGTVGLFGRLWMLGIIIASGFSVVFSTGFLYTLFPFVDAINLSAQYLIPIDKTILAMVFALIFGFVLGEVVSSIWRSITN